MTWARAPTSWTSSRRSVSRREASARARGDRRCGHGHLRRARRAPEGAVGLRRRAHLHGRDPVGRRRSPADGARPAVRSRPALSRRRGARRRFAPNQLDAYRGLKWFNAFVFSLAAIPAFFLARRFLSEGWSLVVAGLTVAVPSSVYSGMVLTEAAAYVTGTLALLALLQVIERPTARRQLYALGAVALAALARPQLVALGAALPVGLALRWWLLPKLARPRVSNALRRLWPTAAAVGFVVVVGVAALRFGPRVASRLSRRLHDLRRRRRRALELVHARQPRAVRRDRPARRRAGGTCRLVAARPRRLGDRMRRFSASS